MGTDSAVGFYPLDFREWLEEEEIIKYLKPLSSLERGSSCLSIQFAIVMSL